MHKFVLKFFEFFKSCLQFLQIITLFGVLLLLLYWTQNLLGDNWPWLGFITPFLDKVVDFASNLSDGAVKLFTTMFEFKYMIAVLFFIIVYFVISIGMKFMGRVEEFYDDSRIAYRKHEEDVLNKQLDAQITAEQKSIKKYKIYVAAGVKENLKKEGVEVNLEEQLKVMKDFLDSKIDVEAVVWENGWIYTFENFEKIDNKLPIFYKLITSTAPLDYTICVQVCAGDTNREIEQLKKLIGLKFVNKITMFFDTMLRYKYNDRKKYLVSQVGVYHDGVDSFQVHEFKEIE